MIAFALAVAVLLAAVCEFVAWLRYHGGGTRFVTEDEICCIEEEIKNG